jgi:hypothetical protein
MSKVLYKYHSRPQTAPITRSNAKPSVAENSEDPMGWDVQTRQAKHYIQWDIYLVVVPVYNGMNIIYWHHWHHH